MQPDLTTPNYLENTCNGDIFKYKPLLRGVHHKCSAMKWLKYFRAAILYYTHERSRVGINQY